MTRFAARRSAGQRRGNRGRLAPGGRGRADRPAHRRLVLEWLEDRLPLSAGALDPTFGDGGRVLTDAGDVTGDVANDVATVAQPDGKILVAGSVEHWSWSTRTDFLVLRYNTDGSLDTSFGENGLARIDFGSHWEQAYALAVDSSGRIVVAGFSQQEYQHDFAVARLTADGALDTSFSGDGKFLYDFAGRSDIINDVAINSQGRILLAGYTTETGASSYRTDMALIRLDASGALDTSFNGTGVLQLDFGGSSDIANAVLIDATGRIVLAGGAYGETASENDFIVARLTDTGAFDNSFDADGIQEITFTGGSNDTASDLTIDSDGNIVVAGYTTDYSSGSYADFGVVRLTSAGALDDSFDGDGKQTLDFDGNYDYAYNVGIDSADRIVLMGGSWGSVNAARLLSDGSVDTSFGDAGKQTLDFWSGRGQFGGGLVDDQDRVLLAGLISRASADIGLARLDTNGVLDATFGEDGLVTTDVGIEGTGDYAYDIAVQPDGRIVVAGSFYVPGYYAYMDFVVARYNPDGSLDASFGTDGIARIEFGAWEAVARSVAIDSQGRIVVGGSARWRSSSDSDFAVTRLTPSGEVDTSFNYEGLWRWGPGGRAAIDFGSYLDYGYGVAVDADDNVVVVGSSDGKFAVARLHGDYGIGSESGKLDYSFGTWGKQIIPFGLYADAQDVAIDPIGRIVVGGSSYQGDTTGSDFAVARLDSTGALDPWFDGDGKQTVDFGGTWTYDGALALTLDSSGRIVLAGYTVDYDTYPYPSDFAIARLGDTGALDPSFDGDGRQTVDLGGEYDYGKGLAIDGSGSIIVSGHTYQVGVGVDFGLAKLAPDGRPVASFGNGGSVATDFGSSSDVGFGVALDAEDRILAVGYSDQWWPTYSDIALARYLNAGPNLTPVEATAEPIAVGEPAAASVDFFYDASKASKTSPHTAQWDWGDGSTSTGTVTESGGSGTATGSHAYSLPGLYTITVTVTDDLGESGSATFQYLVVYDPSAGFVSGGGTLDSPAGAWTAQPWLEGPATFGFFSKYQKGTNTPDGTTVFRFNVADLDFRSSSYQWLVVAGANAKFKGTGTIGGSGDYGFMITATDGQVNGGGGVDKFRIKIWDLATSQVVYDNKLGEADDSNASTAISAGNIIVHSGGQNLLAEHSAGTPSSGTTLTAAALRPVVDQAIAYWGAAGYDGAELATLQSIEFHLADFADDRLGMASSSTNIIWIDTDAAGHGWYAGLGPDSYASMQGGFDLLTVVTHELGHVAGLDGLDSTSHPAHVMTGILAPGTRRLGADATAPSWFFSDPLPRVQRRHETVDKALENDFARVELQQACELLDAPTEPVAWNGEAVDHLLAESDWITDQVVEKTGDDLPAEEEGNDLDRRLVEKLATIR